MSDELPPPPPGVTLMSPKEFLGRKAAPSETPRSGEIRTAHVYRDACGDMRIAIRYADATEEDRPATALEVFLGCRSA